MQDSEGLNLGVKWIENSEGAFQKFESIPKNIRTMAINHDAYVMNVDRDETNPNILFSKDTNKFYLIDFGNAFDSLMTSIAIDVDERVVMGQAGRVKMVREFDESIVIREYLESINQISMGSI